MSTNGQKVHQKHIPLSRPELQQFGKNEMAILGAPCSIIRELAFNICSALPDQYNTAYVDAEHSSDREDETNSDRAFDLHFIQQNSGQQFTFHQPLNSYQLTPLFNEQDLTLLNGNHFEAEAQILIIDSGKPLDPDRLADVKMIILQQGIEEVPPAISSQLVNFNQLPVFDITQIHPIAEAIRELLSETTAPLAGLVLAGGKSTRMHTDKTQLEYHGQPQQLHLYKLLAKFCDQAFLSCRQQQTQTLDEDLNVITDTFLAMGPMGALLSAFREQPDTAWLTVACDLPLLSPETIQTLIDQRNPSKVATAFVNRESGFPEPLITIWEPKSYQLLLQFLGMSYSCPRKVLINSDVELIEPKQPQELMNANTPHQYEQALEVISQQK